MIKQLIEDLAYEKITLGQGLTRAKLIANRTKNITFKEWIGQELQGYNNNEHLPNYRKVHCQTFLVVNLPFGRQDIIPVAVEDPRIKRRYNELKVTDPISQLESTIKDLGTELNITFQLPSSLAVSLASIFQSEIDARGGALEGVRQQFVKSAYVSIIELTKQKLLDTLLDLNDKFPNLENEFMATKENLNKVENIVNNHIWGNNNPVNVATGKNVIQKDITNNTSFSDYSKLESLGVPKDDIEELQNIISANQEDKPALKEKVMKWVMPVMTAITARGLYDNAPQIMDFVLRLTQ